MTVLPRDAGPPPVQGPMPGAARPAGMRPWAFITLMTLLTATSSMASNVFLPSMPAMTVGLHTTVTAAQVTISAFISGFAIAQLAWGPIADRYGRRVVLVMGLGLFFLASIACGFATSIEMLIVARLVQAIGVCCGPVIARAIIRDVYDLRDSARVMSYVAAAFALAPVVGPALGATLQEHFGWRSNFAFMVGASGALLVAILWLLPETLRTRRTLRAGTVAAGYLMLLSDRAYLGYAMCLTLAFTTIFLFNSVAPFFFIGAAGLAPIDFAIPYALTAVSYGITAYLAARWTAPLGIDRTVMLGMAISLAGAAAMIVLVLGGTHSAWLLCGAMGVVTGGFGFVFPNCQAAAIAPFPQQAGAASAMVGFLQMTFAALGGVAIMATYTGSALPTAGSILVLLVMSTVAYWALIMRRAAAGAPA
jgi:MFS transporter, DHA1 family, multidrug resistance protein